MAITATPFCKFFSTRRATTLSGEPLLDAVASVEEQRDGRFLVTLGEETETLERPRDKDIDLQQVVDLRRMLRNAGYGSEVEDIGT